MVGSSSFGIWQWTGFPVYLINIMYKIFTKKNLLALLVFLFVGLLVFSVGDYVFADDDGGSGVLGRIGNRLILAVGWLAYFIVWILGNFLILVIGWLTQVASWSQFVNVPAVITGWTIIRDICNMFFILILLVIAFATILRFESYNIKNLLPKVIIAAILINFSRTICGLMVEMGQIVMLTFVNALGAGSGANNLVHLLGMHHMMSFARDSADTGTLGMETLGGIAVAFIAALIAFIVICAMLGVLIMRVIMIWVYIVLSPLAFLLFAFPHGKGYASRWLSSFSKQIIVGPILAFFLWLALHTAESSSAEFGQNVLIEQNMQGGMMSAFLSGEIFQTYIITIAFLLGGLIIAQEIGEVSGKAASKGLAYVQGGKNWAGKQARRPVDWGVQKSWQATKGTGKLGLVAAGTLDKSTLGRLGTYITGNKDHERRGLVTSGIKGASNLPTNLANDVKGMLESGRHRRDLQMRVLSGENEKGIYTDSETGNRYKGNKDGYYQKVDEHGNWQHDENGKPDYLKDDNMRPVKRMSKSLAAFYNSWDDTQSGARAANNKAQEERVEAEKKKFEDKGTSEEDLVRIMNDGSESRDKRMAAALQAAIESGFETRKQVDDAKNVLGSNSILSNKFEKEVDKNQAHLGYDFTKEKDKKRFNEKLDKGEIDSTKLSSEAYKDKNLIQNLRDYHGKEFNRIAETIFKRGSKKDQDNLSKGLKETQGTHYDEQDQPTEDWKKIGSLHAKLTGEINESFKDKRGDIDTQALSDYIKKGKAADINKIKVDNLEKMIQEVRDNKGPEEARELEKKLAENFDYSKLRSLNKQGDNPELVRTLKDMTKELGKPQDIKYIKSDPELNSM